MPNSMLFLSSKAKRRNKTASSHNPGLNQICQVFAKFIGGWLLAAARIFDAGLMYLTQSNSCGVFVQIDGLVQERRNSNANTLELRLSCTNPLIWYNTTCLGVNEWTSVNTINLCDISGVIHMLDTINWPPSFKVWKNICLKIKGYF